MAKASTSLTSFLKSGAALPAVSDDDLAAALTTALEETTSAGGGHGFLSFSGKTGLYSYGRNKEDLTPDTLFLLEPSVTVQGWVCWKEGKAVGKCEWPAIAPHKAVRLDDLPDHGPYGQGEGWKETLDVGLRDLQTKEEVRFGPSSPSGRNALEPVIREIASRLRAKEPAIPVISFHKGKFDSKGFKNIPKPMIIVEAWVTRAAGTKFFEGNLTIEDLVEGVEEATPRPAKKAPAKKATVKRGVR